MGVNPLDRDAGLARIGETAIRTALGRRVDVRPLIEDDGRVAAQFQDDMFFPRFLTERPSDPGASGERKDFEPFVPHQRFGHGIVHGENRDRLRRPAGFDRQFPQLQGASRRLRRWL
jgi:hypothetical protein